METAVWAASPARAIRVLSPSRSFIEPEVSMRASIRASVLTPVQVLSSAACCTALGSGR